MEFDSRDGLVRVENEAEAVLNADEHEHWEADAPDAHMRSVPRCLRVDNAPIEASGLNMDAFARSCVLMSSLFLGPALLELAGEAAQKKCGDDMDHCRIYGFRASSILSNIAIAAGLISSVLLPLFGAIVDHTHYRRSVGALTAAGLSLVKGIEVSVGRSTWFGVALLQVVSSMLYNTHLTATFAYTSELSSNLNKLSEYNTRFSVTLYWSMILFLLEVLGLSTVFGAGDVGTARISQTITSLTSALVFVYAWKYLFRDRPALSMVPPGMNLLTCGFYKVFATSYQIRTHYVALKWFLAAVMFAEAAMSALSTISTTFMKEVLDLSASEIGLMFFIVLVMGIPGSKLGGWMTKHSGGPVASAKICDLYFIAITTAASLILTGPEHKHLAYLFGGLWGLGLGWLSPVHTTGVVSMIPKGQNAELMGLYMLCVLILSWLPPLVFTVLNEAGFPMSYGLASLNLFFMAGLLCRMCMGDYQAALELVNERLTPMEVEMEKTHMLSE